MREETNDNSDRSDTLYTVPGTSDARLLTGPDVLDADLPEDLARALGRFIGEEPIPSLGEWAATVRRRTGGGSISVEDLCHESEKTAHWGELDGERYHFACFYDAVVLASLVDDPVDLRTEGPDGTVIEARATGDGDLSVTPDDAVFSVGIGDVQPPDREPTPEDVYAAVCPYVRAFPNPEAYARWANSVQATTVAMPLSGATALADALAE